ncbi:NAD+ synthase [Halorutilales archaeon Cl-col2-1]
MKGKSETETATEFETRLDPEATTNEITSFIRSYVEDAGADGVVVGLSGGIDSTVAATVAVEALGSERVLGLVLPTESTTESNTEDAVGVAESLGINYEMIDLQPVVDSFTDAMGGLDEADDNDKKAVGNSKARLRMASLYYVANARDLLVLGTGNRTELLLGYFTKYGDGGVDLLPIGDLYKTEVRELARHVGVPDRIVEKTPTAGLWEGQTDEAELGAPYETVDEILRLMVSSDVDLDDSEIAESIDTDVDTETVSGLRRMYESAEHKRTVPPTP